MGCSSSNLNEQEQQILPLHPDIVNAYIDRSSIVMINKIKDKYESQLQANQKEMNFIQFIVMLKNCDISDNRKKNLYHYFNNNSKKLLKVNKFIQKYCILIKSDTQHFSQIIHRIYCKSVDSDRMQEQDFKCFQQQCHRYLKTEFDIPFQKYPLSWTQFFAILQKQTDWEGLQKSFQIVSIDELPYKAFHQQFERFTMTEYQQKQTYFIVSAQWFSKWIFFYEYEDTDIRNSNYRSASSQISLKKKGSVSSYKRKMSKRLYSSKMISSEDPKNLQNMQPPTEINMTEIQGEYSGQLKPFLNVQRDITVINQKMWSILKNTLGSDLQFERFSIDQYNIDLYPTSIYYFKTDQNSIIDHKTLSICRTKRKTSSFNQLVEKIKEQQNIEKIKFYYKNFGDLNFKQINSQFVLEQALQQNPRVIIIRQWSSNKQKFQKKNLRQKIDASNIQIGDKILAYFSYQDKFVEAFVLNKNIEKKQIFVHFINFSYHYERWITYTQTKLIEQKEKSQQKINLQLKKQSIFNGLSNIGNTCFINSTIQSLISTSIFDKFFLKANLSEKKYPLASVLSKVTKGLINKEKFNLYDFKKIINNKMPMFSGYDQHDAQQFLNLLLDKLDEQLIEKPNIVDELFSGIMQSKFTCLKCKQVKTREQKIHTVSLPIPQAEYNYFVIMVFPIYSLNVHKIVLRLHKNAKMSQYLRQIQQRTSISRYDLIYVQSQYSVLRKFRNQLTFQTNQDKKVTDMGLNSAIQIWIYQKIKTTSIEYRIKENRKKKHINGLVQKQFYDFYTNEENAWVISKIITINPQNIVIQSLKQFTLKQIVIKRTKQIQNQFNELGSKLTEKIFRKLYHRKLDQNSQKMVYFDYEFVIALPKWCSYNDVLTFMDEYLKRIKKPRVQSKISRNSSRSNSQVYMDEDLTLNEDQLRLTSLNSTLIQDKKQPYIVHFLQPLKSCCYFCQKQLKPFHGLDQIKNCCQPQEKDIPLGWVGKQKGFYFVIDWIEIQDYNQSYCNQIKIDKFSISAEQKMKNQQITLQKCLDLWKKPEKIQMKCQKCKNQEHLLDTSIKKAPIITIFHLKQFRYTEEGHFVKLNINLEWQQSINMDTYLSDSNGKSCLYQLYSVVEHKGSTNAGHYTTLTKRKHPLQKKKVWVKFDDQSSQILQKKPQNIENAYLLFFKKVDIPSSAIVHFSI